MNSRKTSFALLSVLIVAGCAYAVWFSIAHTVSKNTNSHDGEATVCTTDAMQCPDGSWVGRSGPNCQFVCPTGTTTQGTGETLLLTKIDQSVSGLNVKITPLQVLEDSRCPHDVQCIQAGTVRVRVQLTSGLGTSMQTFTLNKSITTEAEIITLVSVDPQKESTVTITPGEYRFVFKIAKR
jgi:hypothetical protein